MKPARRIIPVHLAADTEPSPEPTVRSLVRESAADLLERAGGKVCRWAFTVADWIRGSR